VFNTGRELVKAYGKDTADKIRVRMSVLRNARNLADVPKKPPDRCHPLKGDRVGQYAVDLNQPFRLVFEPIRVSSASKTGAPIDESAVTAIRILKVEDYH
jgi:toxin HigB-1